MSQSDVAAGYSNAFLIGYCDPGILKMILNHLDYHFDYQEAPVWCQSNDRKLMQKEYLKHQTNNIEIVYLPVT